MAKANAHINQLKQWLAMEKEAAWNDFQEKIERSDLADRIRNGVSWYPVVTTRSGYGLGEYPFLVVERVKGMGLPHKFYGGKVVRLFSVDPDSESIVVPATVNWVDRDQMKLVLQQDDLPDGYDTGKWGIDLMFDVSSFREMEFALETMEKAHRNRTAELREVLYGDQGLEFATLLPYANANLNPSQNEAVANAVAASDLAVIHGPPGTGKTTTLVATLQELVQNEEQVLVCAPSNAATDLLAQRASEAGLAVVRVGNLSRIDASITPLTLEVRLSDHAQFKELKKSRRKAEEFRNMALKYKRKFGKEEREQRKLMLQEARSLARGAREMEDYLLQQILNEAQVICCTLVGAANRYLRGRRYATVVIDEAGQALEPATLIPIIRAEKVILAGDPLQLPPTVFSPKAMQEGFSKTLLERQRDRLKEVSLLNIQYRMENPIMEFSNQHFYEGRLLSADSIGQRSVPEALHPAIAFIDTAGCGFEEEQHPESNSLFNKGESGVLIKHLSQLHDSLAPEQHFSVAIISPYREQVVHLQEVIDPETWPQLHLSINTIDSFQGQERDLVYLSLVRSNESGTIGFLGDYRRMNVAMTRAKLKLVMIGDSATLGGHSFYQELLDYSESVSGYFSAWEWM